MSKATRTVRARYNRIAPFYDLLDRFIPESWRRKPVGLARGDVLEVGVGTGRNLSLPCGLSRHGHRLQPGHAGQGPRPGGSGARNRPAL